jgi:hypothetical protein
MNQDYIKSITEALLVMEAMAQPKPKRTKEEEIEFGKDSALKPGIRQFSKSHCDMQLHGPSQARDRQPKWSEDDWDDLFLRGHKAIESPAYQLQGPGRTPKKVEPGQVIVYSIGKKQGFVVNVAHKVQGTAKEGVNTRVITVPPRGASMPADKKTQRILIEGMEFTEDQIIYIE